MSGEEMKGDNKEQQEEVEMSEEAPKEKKWTAWSVVSSGNGAYRCKRTNVEDERDAEYSEVGEPVFSAEELGHMIGFGQLGLLRPDQIAEPAYDNRYRGNAFRLCAALNGGK